MIGLFKLKIVEFICYTPPGRGDRMWGWEAFAGLSNCSSILGVNGTSMASTTEVLVEVFYSCKGCVGVGRDGGVV